MFGRVRLEQAFFLVDGVFFSGSKCHPPLLSVASNRRRLPSNRYGIICNHCRIVRLNGEPAIGRPILFQFKKRPGLETGWALQLRGNVSASRSRWASF